MRQLFGAGSRWFKSEKIDSFASQEAILLRVIPVMTALSIYGFVLKVDNINAVFFITAYR